MKTYLIILCICIAALLAGCAAQPAPAAEAPVAPSDAGQPDAAPPAGAETVAGPARPDEPEETGTVLLALIVDGADTGELVLAGEGDAEGVYLLDAAGIPVALDGAAADASALEDGMRVEIVCDGALPEEIPSELVNAVSIRAFSRGTARNPGGTAYDLCGLYLQVLDDLWEKDAGLNGGAVYTSVDLSAAPGDLSAQERYAVAWIFARDHGTQPLALSYEELIGQGYLTEADVGGSGQKFYQWEDGVLFSITADDWDEGEFYSLAVVKFSARKWRSPLGAYMFTDCSAVWPQMGTWDSYNIGGEAIS